jgi:hypothetical protein
MLRPYTTFSYQPKHSMTTNFKTIYHALGLMMAVGALAISSARAAEPAPAIRIDGDLSDAAWQKARAIEAFKTFDGKETQAATTGLAMTDANFLYLAFRCQEPQMDKLQTSPYARDGAVYTNDCIEVFIAPFENQARFYHLIVDAANQIYDAFSSDGKEDARYEIPLISQTQKQADGWTLEMAIPLCDIGLSNAREALMNFGRERKPVSELSSWHGLFAQPKTWQTLPLALDKKYNVDVRDWNFGALQYGDNALSAEFVSSAAPVGVLSQAQENGQWKTKSQKTAPSTAGPTTRVALPYSLAPLDKPQAVRFVLENNGQPVFRATYRLALPAAALVETLSAPYYYSEENWGFVQLESLLSEDTLKSSRIRLIVKAPNGKTVSTQEIHPLQKTTRAAFRISSWATGTGSLTTQLITDGKVLAQQNVPIPKRPGPFAKSARR